MIIFSNLAKIFEYEYIYGIKDMKKHDKAALTLPGLTVNRVEAAAGSQAGL